MAAESSAGALSPEQLLGNQAWMRGLARSLLADPGAADDVVQEAQLAAWQRPPREARTLPAWLSGVVRNLSRRSLRDRHRRAAREQRAARHERIANTPAELLERAEMQRNVAQAVLDLKEPYRSAVLFRFFDDLSPAEIAARQGIPVATVRTRIDRALEQLRGRLDRMHGGDRAEWSAVLVPMAGFDAGAQAAGGGAAASSAPVANTAANTVTNTAAAAAAKAIGAGAAAAATLQIGGLIMSQKIVIAAAVALIVAGVGFGIGRKTAEAPEADPAAEACTVPLSRLESVEASHEAAVAEVATLKTEIESRTKHEAELEAKVSALDAEIAQLHASAAPKPVPAGEADLLYVSFGKWAELEGIRNANWDEMAEASAAMTEMLVDLVHRSERGEGPPEGFQGRIVSENAKLVKYAMSVLGKIPTHANGNGEYCHPITFANIMASMLENAEQPFSKEQIDAIVRYGEAYDDAYQKAQDSYTEESFASEKFLDELVLKRDAMRLIEELLTEEQRLLLIRPEVHNRAQIDVLSPALMLIMVVEPWPREAPEKVRDEVEQSYASRFSFELERLQGAAAIFDEWFADVQGLLVPMAPDYLPYMLLDEAIVAGQAEVKALKALLAELAPEENVRKLVREHRGWMLPRVLKTPDAPPAPPAPAAEKEG
ncbi:MAG: RNA polymerase sigma factor [Planctomycetes bacterium]|nr:RNA polymerase sigma factor [Planctomycetota bacterium]